MNEVINARVLGLIVGFCADHTSTPFCQHRDWHKYSGRIIGSRGRTLTVEWLLGQYGRRGSPRKPNNRPKREFFDCRITHPFL